MRRITNVLNSGNINEANICSSKILYNTNVHNRKVMQAGAHITTQRYDPWQHWRTAVIHSYRYCIAAQLCSFTFIQKYEIHELKCAVNFFVINCGMSMCTT